MADKDSRGRPHTLLRRVVVAVVIVACSAILGVGACVGGVYAHYASTPDFATYVRQHPVDDAWVAARVFDGPILAGGGSFALGDVDPFAIRADDGASPVERLGLEFTIRHGDDVLLDLFHEIAVASGPDGNDRIGFAVRTPRCATAPDLRAVARCYIDRPDALVGPGSARQGIVTVDVLLVAGARAPDVRVVRAAPEQLPALATIEGNPSWLELLREMLPPMGTPPEEGLVHHLRVRTFLTWHTDGSNYESAGLAPSVHFVNTREYSYEARVSVEGKPRSGWTRSQDWKRSYSVNGRVW